MLATVVVAIARVGGTDDSVEPFATFPWPLGIAGVLALAVGLLLVIWPRKSGETIWKINQAMRPWRNAEKTRGVTVAMGCAFLLVSAAMFYGTWATLQR